MNKILINRIDLQQADDGNTTYYGGEFTVTRDNVSNDFNFHGSDRGFCPAEQVLEVLEQTYGVKVGSVFLDNGDVGDDVEHEDVFIKFTDAINLCLCKSIDIEFLTDEKHEIVSLDPKGG